MNTLMLEEKAKELAILSHRIHKLRIKLTYLEEERRKLKIEYESLDRRQAMTDGRFKAQKVKSQPSKSPESKLTREQILAIARKLGANV